MNTAFIVASVTLTLLAAVWLGRRLRSLLPADQLSGESRDSVKQATGLVATMSALLLGLLVSSAQESQDTTRSEVTEVAAKAAFLDRVLAAYGPETTTIRGEFRARAQAVITRLWPESASPQSAVASDGTGEALFATIQNLVPRDETQRSLRDQAVGLALELAELLELLVVHASPSISQPLLLAVVAWLFLIFLSFGLQAPANATTNFSLAITAVSVAGAVGLILELDRPFDGWIQVSSQPLLDVLGKLALPVHAK